MEQRDTEGRRIISEMRVPRRIYRVASTHECERHLAGRICPGNECGICSDECHKCQEGN